MRIYGHLLLCLLLLWSGRYLEVCREESPATSLCVTLGDNGNTHEPSVMASLITRLSALSGERLRRLAGPRLLISFCGLVIALLTHRHYLAKWGNTRHLGGVLGVLIAATTPLVGASLPLIWLLDALVSSTHGVDVGSPVAYFSSFLNTALL